MPRPHRLVLSLAAAALSVCAITGLTASAPADASTPLSTLQAEVSSALSGTPATEVAAYADVAGLGQVGVNPDAALKPASNEKLLTTISALDQLGPSYVYTTRLTTDGPLSADGLVLGDLVVHGSGDPSIDDARLGQLAADLAAQGIHRFAGQLYIDDSRYAEDLPAPGWQPGFLPQEAAQVSAFAIDNNTISTSGPYVSSPTTGNAERLRMILAQHGITIAGGDVSGEPSGASLPGFPWLPPAQRTLATTTSGSLASLVRPMLKESVNWYAEMLLHEIGAHRSGQGSRGTGISAVNAEAAALHVPVGPIYDGSGLSYNDAESPTTLVDWLEAAHGKSFFPDLADALPISCTDGTLQYRLCGADLTGRIHAKTGTLSGVTALSGYTHTLSGRWVTFSILINGASDWTAATTHMDAAVADLARFDS